MTMSCVYFGSPNAIPAKEPTTTYSMVNWSRTSSVCPTTSACCMRHPLRDFAFDLFWTPLWVCEFQMRTQPCAHKPIGVVRHLNAFKGRARTQRPNHLGH